MHPPRSVSRHMKSANPTPHRLGLCCQFMDAPIHFRRATHKYVSSLDAASGRAYIVSILRDNAAALVAAVQHCSDIGIRAFRINSQILPLATHPVSGYRLSELDENGDIRTIFESARALATELDIRLSFHPDQFVVLNSEQPRVVAASVEEMRIQAEVAVLVGADVLTLHAGSSAGGMEAAMERLEQGIEALSPDARARLALENDDRRFTPASLLPLCERLAVPLVYDVHHHRCNPDTLSVDEATELAESTWREREPHFHISSPRDGWGAKDTRPHADYVTPDDFPKAWRGRRMTIDVEAKAKERAVIALREALSGNSARS